jgi:hypothetical protein
MVEITSCIQVVVKKEEVRNDLEVSNGAKKFTCHIELN